MTNEEQDSMDDEGSNAVRHPIQPLYVDQTGVVRFKPNAIVRYLLDNGGITMNKLAVMDFSDEDREQFAQLIGYSCSGACDLSYVRDITISVAESLFKDSAANEQQERVAYLETLLRELRATLREPMGILYSKHPEDFCDEDGNRKGDSLGGNAL